MMDNARFSAIVTGRVQGVGYRNFAQRHALQLGINGYIRNGEDRDVEIVAEGPREQLIEFLGLLSQGPRAAHVEDVHVVWEPFSDTFRSFLIRF